MIWLSSLQGAAVLRMLSNFLTEDLFKAGLSVSAMVIYSNMPMFVDLRFVFVPVHVLLASECVPHQALLTPKPLNSSQDRRKICKNPKFLFFPADLPE